MARRHLHELLKEDQEPFQLSDYITDRRRLLNRPPPPQEAQIQVKRRNRIVAAALPVSFRRNVCFFSFHDSPDLRKSPRFEFPKSPCKTPHNVFLQIPARTAAVLLEAALRIQRHSSSTTETKPPKGQFGFRFFGSVFKKLTHWNRSRASEIGVAGGVEAHVSNARLSSAVWSKRNDGKSLDLKASHGSTSEEDESYKVTMSDSQESPFRFVLQRSPSSGDSTPEFPSPATSPTLDKEEENVKTKGAGGDAEEEEDKEQSSPVSVLDPLFNDDDDTHEDGFGIDCSSVLVQRTKQQLSEKARRFNNNAALDPVELDKTMEEGREGEDVFVESALSRVGKNNEMRFRECLRMRSSFCHMWQIPEDMERLVSELIVEERLKPNDSIDDGEAVAERVCQRLEAWKQVESNTIDMMVEMDLRMELNGRKGSQPQVGEVAVEIEVAIFGLLVHELSEEVNAFGYQVCRSRVCGGSSHGHQ